MARAAGDWRKRLTWELRAAKRLFVLGVGNPDRADDGAGGLCARILEREMANAAAADSPCHSVQGAPEAMRVLDGGEVPESATGVIREFRPTHVLIIDAASAGREPGSVFFIDNKKIPEGDFTTHRIPLSQLVRYLEETVGCRVILLGIEPGSLSPGKPMSRAVRESAAILADALEAAWPRKKGRPAHRRPRPETP